MTSSIPQTPPEDRPAKLDAALVNSSFRQFRILVTQFSEAERDYLLEKAAALRMLKRIPLIIEAGVSQDSFDKSVAIARNRMLFLDKEPTMLVILLQARNPGQPIRIKSPALRWFARHGSEKIANAIAEMDSGFSNPANGSHFLKSAAPMLGITGIMLAASVFIPVTTPGLIAGSAGILGTAAVTGYRTFHNALIRGRLKRLTGNVL